MFVHLTKRTKYLVRVRLFSKRTNTNELPAERFTNCSPNVWFVCSPTVYHQESTEQSPFTNYNRFSNLKQLHIRFRIVFTEYSVLTVFQFIFQ
ncbi:hypothetical protein Hanom_Chr09g00798951 [Helianthus anomalus]